MAGRYGSTGRPIYPDYQQLAQAYRALRAQYEQLVTHSQQQAQRIAQLERALMQANQSRPPSPLPGADADQLQALAAQRAELQAQAEQLRAETEELRAALERAQQQSAQAQQERQTAQQALDAARERIAQLQAASEETEDAVLWRERFLRQQADAESFRRRQERRFSQQATEERRALLRDMLPLADHLELGLDQVARDAAAAADPRLQAYADSLRAVRQAFLDTLERYGTRPVSALGEPFDPTRHEAMGQVASDDVPEGHVAQVMQNGFADADGLVRPARVLVSSGAPAGEIDAER